MMDETIQVVIGAMMLCSAFWRKKEIPETRLSIRDLLCFTLFKVIRLGFEPKTPSLKGMCSTY